ncbi:hypothetical protein DFH08DRAFT_1041899 [Mycena albidolilacea]|uniref:Uncharacterized protein n=1 Tax=Mycena albidolilacea TaxID=1033008 RepID=A0AAD6ZAY5_9AGAR|nr:hypothetical protein DFH08DRAFT_1041899 [Mycena albidolilacea]
MAWERYQDDAEARRVISRSNPSRYSAWFGLNPGQSFSRWVGHSSRPSTLVLPDTSRSSICKSHGHLVYAVEPLYPPTSNSTSNANNLCFYKPNLASRQDGNESNGASPEPETEEKMVAVKKAKEDADLGLDPATRMNMGWGPCKILIRSLVAQKTDNYFSSCGLPHPNTLLFMDEYYNWELESASKGDRSVDGSGEDGEGESFELEQQQQAFVLEMTPVLIHRHKNNGGEGSSEIDMDLGSGMGGVIPLFYVALLPAHILQGGPGPFAQIPLPLPPLPLHLFTDIWIAPAAGAACGWGMLVDPASARQRGVGAVTMRGSRVEGVPDEELPPLPRLCEGELPMLPMRGLWELVRWGRRILMRRGQRRDQERREMSEAFEPDAVVWQEECRGGRWGDSSVDANTDYDNEESGIGGGGTNGGVALGLLSAFTPSSAGSSSSGSSMVGGVEMGIGMFGMALGAMGLGWFGGSPTPPTPVPVAVGDVGGVSVGDRERKHESSLSYALGV